MVDSKNHDEMLSPYTTVDKMNCDKDKQFL